MTKIGIINYQFSNHNYGAVLQAAALHHYISSEMELDAEHIDFVPASLVASRKIKLKASIKRLLMNLGLVQKSLSHDLFINPQVFEEFRLNWLPRTKNKYNTIDDLTNESFEYSHVIVGSDQVWRPSYTAGNGLVYFLTFIGSNVKRVSYAASFGNDRWELGPEESSLFKDEISKFKAISVREKSGVNICNSVFDVNATHVLDPTLLVGERFFELIINKELNYADSVKADSNYIVYYKLDVDSEFDGFLENLSAKLNTNTKNIYYQQTMKGNSYYSVAEWLSFIRNSKYVVSDSFHCICFAILFKKPFLYYPNSNRGLARLESLLGELGLDKHIFRGDSCPVQQAVELNCVDYSLVTTRLSELRKESSHFLNNALDQIENKALDDD